MKFTHAFPCILHCLLTIFAGEVHFYCWLSPWRKPLHRTSSISHPVKSRSQQKLLSFNKTSLFYWPGWRGLNEMKMLHGVSSTLTRISEFRTIVERHLWRGNNFEPCTATLIYRELHGHRFAIESKKLLRDAFKCRACQLQIQFAFAQFLSIKIYFDSLEINLTSEREEHFTAAAVSDSSFCSKHPQLTASGSSQTKHALIWLNYVPTVRFYLKVRLKCKGKHHLCCAAASSAGAVREIDVRNSRAHTSPWSFLSERCRRRPCLYRAPADVKEYRNYLNFSALKPKLPKWRVLLDCRNVWLISNATSTEHIRRGDLVYFLASIPSRIRLACCKFRRKSNAKEKSRVWCFNVKAFSSLEWMMTTCYLHFSTFL